MQTRNVYHLSLELARRLPVPPPAGVELEHDPDLGRYTMNVERTRLAVIGAIVYLSDAAPKSPEVSELLHLLDGELGRLSRVIVPSPPPAHHERRMPLSELLEALAEALEEGDEDAAPGLARKARAEALRLRENRPRVVPLREENRELDRDLAELAERREREEG